MLDGSASAVILLVSFAIAEVSILLCSIAIAEGIILGRVAIIEAFSIILCTYVVAEVIIDIVNSFAIAFGEPRTDYRLVAILFLIQCTGLWGMGAIQLKVKSKGDPSYRHHQNSLAT